MKLRLLVCASMFFAISSCSKSEMPIGESANLEHVSSAKSEEVRVRALKVLSGEANTTELTEYFSLFDGNVFRSSKVFSVGTDKFSLYLKEHEITLEELLVSLSQNPSEVEFVVKSTTSQAFYSSFMKALSSSNEISCIEGILSNRSLNSVEKGVLVLLLVDGKNSQLRSLSSCAKRYARLSVIAAKATAMSFLDIESAAEYASRELKRMKESGNYVC